MDRLDYLKDQHRKAKEGGYYLGYKPVRGAYMEKENVESNMGYPTPLFVPRRRKPIQTSTMPFVTLWTPGKVISLFAGTHNEASTYLILECMERKGTTEQRRKHLVWSIVWNERPHQLQFICFRLQCGKILAFWTGSGCHVLPYS